MGFFDFFKSKKDNPSKDRLPEKTELNDFFKIDINRLFQYSPVLVGTEATSFGTKVTKYSLNLPQEELGMFNQLEINEVADNELNIKFIGGGKCMTDELKEFIAFCVSKYGNDSLGLGSISSQDKQHISNNTFSRFWEDVRVDNISGEFAVSILGLSKN